MEFLTAILHRCWRRAARCRGWAWLAALGLLCASARAGAPDVAISDEYRVKAVFLFNFAQFVEWPETAFPSKTAPIVIGLVGDDPFGVYLDELVRDEKVGLRRLEVRRYARIGDASGCHILFVGRTAPDELRKIFAALQDRPVLTVGDADAFARLGGMVRFVTESGKIRLRINLEAARACGLTISSKIIRPGTLVTAGKD